MLTTPSSLQVEYRLAGVCPHAQADCPTRGAQGNSNLLKEVKTAERHWEHGGFVPFGVTKFPFRIHFISPFARTVIHTTEYAGRIPPLIK